MLAYLQHSTVCRHQLAAAISYKSGRTVTGRQEATSETHAVLQESCAHFFAASTPVRLCALSSFLVALGQEPTRALIFQSVRHGQRVVSTVKPRPRNFRQWFARATLGVQRSGEPRCGRTPRNQWLKTWPGCCKRVFRIGIDYYKVPNRK